MDHRHASNMTSGNTIISWGVACLAGFIAFLLLIIVGEWTLSAAFFSAGAIALVLIVLFTMIFGRDLTPLSPRLTDRHPRPVGPDAPLRTKGVGTGLGPEAADVAEPDAASSPDRRTADRDDRMASGPTTGAGAVSEAATTPAPPATAPDATAAVVAGSAGSGGGAAAATSPAATGTPVGEGAATGAERTEADLAARAEQPMAEPAVPMSSGPGRRPEQLDAPRGGDADDLKRIKGIGPKMERTCNDLGFWHFDQIAAWTDEEVAWVDDNLEGFKGRVTRDEWVAQARDLVAGRGPSAEDARDDDL